MPICWTDSKVWCWHRSVPDSGTPIVKRRSIVNLDGQSKTTTVEELRVDDQALALGQVSPCCQRPRCSMSPVQRQRVPTVSMCPPASGTPRRSPRRGSGAPTRPVTSRRGTHATSITSSAAMPALGTTGSRRTSPSAGFSATANTGGPHSVRIRSMHDICGEPTVNHNSAPCP